MEQWLGLTFLLLAVVACSDSSVGDDVNGNNLAVYSTVEDLPPCTTANEGEQLFVKSEGIIRVCADEKWFATMERASGCTTEPLTDSSGVKIICGGDSVGVVLNGKNGANGQGGSNAAHPDSSENGIAVLDSEKVATSLEGVSGYSQKGPFINGSKVTVIELESGRNLNQTGNTFESKIQSDDGQFKLNARMMVSQYVELHAEGYYRNEVTGKNSEAPLTLYAITDVSKRDGGIVNINLLTHLEYHRVVHLVKEKKMKVFAAKDSAEKEIFNLLNINSKGFFSSEDLNIAGSSDGDAALLAFSVMFQGDRNVSQLTELLTNVATDMEKDGTWDNAKVRDSIADWAEEADVTGKLDTIRANVESWGLSAMVPNFEKYVRAFWTKEYGLPACDKDNVDTLMAAGAKRLAKSKNRYVCVDSAKVGYMWRRATDLEKDTYGWKPGADAQIKAGDVTGTKKYVYDGPQERWREMTDLEEYYGVCTETVEADSAASVKQNKFEKIGDEYFPYVVCKDRQWSGCSAYYADTRKYETEALDGTVRRGDYTTDVYVFEQNLGFWRVGWDFEGMLNKGCTNPNVGEVIHFVTDNSDEYYSCRRDSFYVDYGWYTGFQFYKPGNGDYMDSEDEHRVETEQRWVKDDHEVAENTFEDNGTIYNLACPSGTMKKGSVLKNSDFICDGGFWRAATAEEERFQFACTKEIEFYYAEEDFGSSYVCKHGIWNVALIYDEPMTISTYVRCEPSNYYTGGIHENTCNENYDRFIDDRDNQEYKTIGYDFTLSSDEKLKRFGNRMGEPMVWMAQNLNFAGNADFPYVIGHNTCYLGKEENCAKGGRFYTWAAAMNMDDKYNRSDASVPANTQGACPNGWHIPSIDEWNNLQKFIAEVYPQGEVKSLVAPDQSTYLMGNNMSGFSALYVGGECTNMDMDKDEAVWYNESFSIWWWSANQQEMSGKFAETAGLSLGVAGLSSGFENEKSYGLPVRCVKNYTLSNN